IRDSIKVSYNGNNKLLQLEAYGQNAHFLRDKEVTTNETWTNDLPYVILGYLHVNTNQKLTIEKGCRIYVHANAPIVIDGSLQVNGLKDTIDRVYFRGDRLDEPYKNYPASWPGIFFSTTSMDNVLNYAVLKNSYQSIAAQDPSPNANPKVTLNQCIIDNSYDAGIITLNSSVTATNCLLSNCGKNIYLIKGGTYRFTHCTATSFSNNYLSHKDPVLTVADNDGTDTRALDAIFTNCIFWGDNNGLVENEVIVDKKGTASFTVTFDYNLWRVQTAPSGVTLNQILNNKDPQFDSIDVSHQYYDFHLKTTSPAVDTGKPTAVSIDLDGKPRPVGIPDLGSFEK
ncbi:MAG: choice-of-anchor Q domain-containing protein, partial [Chitinophagaceae bacterium]